MRKHGHKANWEPKSGRITGLLCSLAPRKAGRNPGSAVRGARLGSPPRAGAIGGNLAGGCRCFGSQSHQRRRFAPRSFGNCRGQRGFASGVGPFSQTAIIGTVALSLAKHDDQRPTLSTRYDEQRRVPNNQTEPEWTAGFAPKGWTI